MDHAFLVETYASERLKTLSVWSMFADEDLNVRPHPRWFVGMLGSTSARRHGRRRTSGWRSSAATPTTRATGSPPSGPRTPRGGLRRSHTAHHRAEQTTLLRLLGRQVWSVYGPSADTGGLPANAAPTIYAYADVAALLEGEARGGAKAPLPGPGRHASTERPER